MKTWAGDSVDTGGTSFTADFTQENATLPNGYVSTYDWRRANGSLNTIKGNGELEFGERSWLDYEVDFRIKRLKVNPKDQHFGVFLRNRQRNHLRFLCRGDAVNLIETIDGKTTDSALVGRLPKAMSEGTDSPWVSFKVRLTGQTAKVTIDGVEIGSVSGLRLESGGCIKFYVYNVDLSIQSVSVTVLKRMSIEVPAVFSDGMVLQQNTPCPVWGRSTDGKPIRLSFRDRTVTAVPRDGQWKTEIETGSAGGPFPLKIEGSDTLEIVNVYVGDVWLLSGQSNAAQSTTYREAKPGSPVHFFNAISRSMDWFSTGRIPMIAWHFGHDLQAEQNVPVGIICCAVGGTSIEQWRPVTDPDVKNAGPGGRLGPSRELYDEWTRPLQPYRIKGILWWQGESNARNAALYGTKFSALISEWRNAWQQGDVPFIWVQLQRIEPTEAAWLKMIADGRSPIAEWQRQSLSMPNTAMVATYDVTAGDLHPPEAEKAVVAQRLLQAAMHLAYGSTAEYSGPMPERVYKEGDSLVIEFSHVGSGLKTMKNLTVSKAEIGTDLVGFELENADGTSLSVRAGINGKSVVIPLTGIEHPTAVHYAWGSMPSGNLYNSEDLPAPTFRLDLPVTP